MEVAFSRELQGNSRYIMRDLRAMHTLRPLMWLVSQIAPSTYAFLDGFVWEEDGRVVGNLSLSQLPHGDWIVSNVAVLPAFRRRGIARALMRAAIERVREHRGRQILLQVHEQNAAAIALYESLAFTYVDTVIELQAHDLRPSALPAPPEVRVVPPIADRWYEAYELARVADSASRFGRPISSPSAFRVRDVGRLERFWQRVIPPAKERWWAMADDEVLALLTLNRRNGAEPDLADLLIAPRGVGVVEPALANQLTKRLRGRAVVHVTLPSTQPAARDALVQVGFRQQRTLNQMRLRFSALTTLPF